MDIIPKTLEIVLSYEIGGKTLGPYAWRQRLNNGRELFPEALSIGTEKADIGDRGFCPFSLPPDMHKELAYLNTCHISLENREILPSRTAL